MHFTSTAILVTLANSLVQAAPLASSSQLKPRAWPWSSKTVATIAEIAEHEAPAVTETLDSAFISPTADLAYLPISPEPVTPATEELVQLQYDNPFVPTPEPTDDLALRVPSNTPDPDFDANIQVASESQYTHPSQWNEEPISSPNPRYDLNTEDTGPPRLLTDLAAESESILGHEEPNAQTTHLQDAIARWKKLSKAKKVAIIGTGGGIAAAGTVAGLKLSHTDISV